MPPAAPGRERGRSPGGRAAGGRRRPGVAAPPPLPGAPPVHLRERSQRAAVALRQVAGGARRSIFGAVMFAFLGMGTLLVALPQVMAYTLALVCLGLAVAAARQFLARRRSGE